MDRTYLDHFLGADSFICSKCRAASLEHFNYCPHCGTEQPLKEALEIVSRRPSISDIEEVRKGLTEMRGLKVRLWDYCVTLCVLQIRVAQKRAANYEDSINIVIGCVGTHRIAIPTLGWQADFVLKTAKDDKYGQLQHLIDEKAGVHIECERVCLYENMAPAYVGGN